MTRKYRRIPVDFEILIAAQEVSEITADMDLLDEEIVEAVAQSMTEEAMRSVAHLLRMRNPKLENIAIMSEGETMRLVLLFKDKSGVIVGRRRSMTNMIRNMMAQAA